MQKPDRATFTPLDFLGFREAGALVLTPKFQRRDVWPTATRSYFIDTLLRQMPVPPIYVRAVQSPERNRVIREVIDGQQRIAAVLDFIEGKYRLSRGLPAPWAGKVFSRLSDAEQSNISTYGFATEVFQGISDPEVLEIFARLNVNGVALNKQELRNGRFFGLFKQTAYSISHEHVEYWRRFGIFSERAIARMLDVEFVSELLAAALDGMQDKKTSLDKFYRDFDEVFAERDTIVQRVVGVLAVIADIASDLLPESEFRRPYLFYSLFCALYDRQHTLPKADRPSVRRALTLDDKVVIREVMDKLSTLVKAGRAHEDVPNAYLPFVGACLAQTDNLTPRSIRFATIRDLCFAQA